MQALTRLKDKSHGSTEEVPEGASATSGQRGARFAALLGDPRVLTVVGEQLSINAEMLRNWSIMPWSMPATAAARPIKAGPCCNVRCGTSIGPTRFCEPRQRFARRRDSTANSGDRRFRQCSPLPARGQVDLPESFPRPELRSPQATTTPPDSTTLDSYGQRRFDDGPERGSAR